MNLSERKTPQKLFECRISQNRPIAQHQWQMIVKCETQAFPSFELGNFCMLSLPDRLEPLTPRPFAIVDHKDNEYTFIYRVTGKLTKAMTQLLPGSRVDLIGPLGKGIPRSQFSSGIHHFIAGGVGYASLLPLIDEAQKSKATSHIYYGVRTDLEVIRRSATSAVFSSDDGSVGVKGRVTDLLRGRHFGPEDSFYVCGPTPMMKAVYELIPAERSIYFLEETMGCGFGICVGCVIPMRVAPDKIKNVRSCMEGPVFNGAALSEWKVCSWN